MARDLLLSYAHGIQSQRATEDLDFAFALDDWHAFDALRSALISRGGFANVPGVSHRLRFDGTRIDLIPFGGVERGDGTIDWPPPQDTRMVVLGFREAMGKAVAVKLPGGVTVAVASLPALALLELFAWATAGTSSPERMQAICGWCCAIPRGGQSGAALRRAAHLLEAPDYDDDLAGARLLGSDARRLLDGGDGRSASLAGALALLAGDGPEGPVQLAADMAAPDLQHAVDMRVAFRAGLCGAAGVTRA